MEDWELSLLRLNLMDEICRIMIYNSQSYESIWIRKFLRYFRVRIGMIERAEVSDFDLAVSLALGSSDCDLLLEPVCQP